jgi:hypothetical protein
VSAKGSARSALVRREKLEAPAVPSGDRRGDRQTKPGALVGRACREEWVEDRLTDGGGYAETVVGDDDTKMVGRFLAADDDDAAIRHRLRRIEEKIHNDLVDLARRAACRRADAELEANLDVPFEQVCIEQRDRRADAAVEIRHLCALHSGPYVGTRAHCHLCGLQAIHGLLDEGGPHPEHLSDSGWRTRLDLSDDWRVGVFVDGEYFV